MSQDRMQRMETLYSEALALPANQRKPFLDTACGDDDDLRREIEGLLKYQQQADTYMDQPAFHVVAQSLADGSGALVDRTLGRYQLLSLVGRGGMADVYCAVDSRLNRLVAVKVLPVFAAGDRHERFERFEQEARAVAGLNHPHICTLHDAGNDGEIHFLVFEYMAGESLAERLAKGPLPLTEALKYAVQIAEALEYAHEQGVIHLDLKPSNIMLLRNGVKLLDFGISELRDGAVDTSGNSPTPAWGTPGYMSPEQIEGRAADFRTDIFSFGVVLYEMLTGQPAFPARGSDAASTLTIKDNPLPVSHTQPAAPPVLDLILARCLSRLPTERWQSISEMLEYLRQAANR